VTLLGEFGNLLLLQGMRPEHIPREVPFHLDDFFILLERVDPQIVARWIDVVTDISPRTVYIGVRQKDVTRDELQDMIEELSHVCNVNLSIIVEDVSILDVVPPPTVSAVRLVFPQDKISFSFIESVRSSLDPDISLEISVLGPPISENRKVVESLIQVLPLVDRVVRHVSPNVESIHAAQKEYQLLGEKFFLQIDTYRGGYEIKPEELYMLLQAAHKVTDRIIIEVKYPPATPELLEFLKHVYAV
jgi:hypothetical protein